MSFPCSSRFLGRGRNQSWRQYLVRGDCRARLYEQVLSKNPATVRKVIDLAAKLESPFTVKQIQGHLRWMDTAGELEVDGKSYAVPKAKEPKAAIAPASQR